MLLWVSKIKADLLQNCAWRELCFWLFWFLVWALISFQPKTTNQIEIKTVEQIISERAMASVKGNLYKICHYCNWHRSIRFTSKIKMLLKIVLRNFKMVRDWSDIMKPLSRSQIWLLVLCRCFERNLTPHSYSFIENFETKNGMDFYQSFVLLKELLKTSLSVLGWQISHLHQ